MMLSADISGFTALSEKLAGKGKAGAEEIAEIVNSCFTALIDAAYDYGGEVLKFGFTADSSGRTAIGWAARGQISIRSARWRRRRVTTESARITG